MAAMNSIARLQRRIGEGEAKKFFNKVQTGRTLLRRRHLLIITGEHAIFAHRIQSSPVLGLSRDLGLGTEKNLGFFDSRFSVSVSN